MGNHTSCHDFLGSDPKDENEFQAAFATAMKNLNDKLGNAVSIECKDACLPNNILSDQCSTCIAKIRGDDVGKMYKNMTKCQKCRMDAGTDKHKLEDCYSTKRRTMWIVIIVVVVVALLILGLLLSRGRKTSSGLPQQYTGRV
jgi:hypothetical protein